MCKIMRIVEKNPIGESGLIETLRRNNVNVTEKEIQMILGCRNRMLSQVEIRQRVWARKSLVATRNIKRGDPLTKDNVAIKRPEEGILPKNYDKVLKRKTKCDIEEGTPIKWEMLE